MEPIGRISLVVLIKKRMDAWAAVKDANLMWQGSIGHGHLAPSTSRNHGRFSWGHRAAHRGDPEPLLDALDAAGRELYFEPLNVPGGGAVAEWRPRDDRPTGSESHGDLDFLSWRGADRRDHGEDGRVSRVITRVTREIFFDDL